MIRLGLLGPPTIQTSGGASVDGLISQPKRLALLAYLSVQSSGEELRERILPIFWPESDAAHARLSLRQAIHFIRAATARAGEPEILVPDKGDKIRLDRGRLWCDVVEFETRLSAADYVGALALYRGDFLQGVSVPGAQELKHWLDRERARLREAAERACRIAAEHELESGSPRQALYWAHRGQAIAPGSESLAGFDPDRSGSF